MQRYIKISSGVRQSGERERKADSPQSVRRRLNELVERSLLTRRGRKRRFVVGRREEPSSSSRVVEERVEVGLLLSSQRRRRGEDEIGSGEGVDGGVEGSVPERRRVLSCPEPFGRRGGDVLGSVDFGKRRGGSSGGGRGSFELSGRDRVAVEGRGLGGSEDGVLERLDLASAGMKGKEEESADERRRRVKGGESENSPQLCVLHPG